MSKQGRLNGRKRHNEQTGANEIHESRTRFGRASNCASDKSRRTLMRQLFKRDRDETAGAAQAAEPQPTPAIFNPREEENMHFEEKVENWLYSVSYSRAAWRKGTACDIMPGDKFGYPGVTDDTDDSLSLYNGTQGREELRWRAQTRKTLRGYRNEPEKPYIMLQSRTNNGALPSQQSPARPRAARSSPTSRSKRGGGSSQQQQQQQQQQQSSHERQKYQQRVYQDQKMEHASAALRRVNLLCAAGGGDADRFSRLSPSINYTTKVPNHPQFYRGQQEYRTFNISATNSQTRDSVALNSPGSAVKRRHHYRAYQRPIITAQTSAIPAPVR